MEIKESKITKIRLSELDRLDPVNVFIEDHELGKGEITIKCYGKSWSAFWGGMGGMNVMDFFLSCGDDYLANCLWDHSNEQTEVDYDAIKDKIRSIILSGRQDQSLDKDFAREIYDVEDWEDLAPKYTYDKWHCPLLVSENEFDDFAESYLDWLELPERSTSDFRYLLRIIAVVKEGFINLKQPKAA